MKAASLSKRFATRSAVHLWHDESMNSGASTRTNVGPFTVIDHVQLAMPPGEEHVARNFYCEVLGMREIVKPAELARRGGCWFESGNVQIHLGVEADFRPAKKAHPALRCADYDDLISRLRTHNVAVDEPNDIPEVKRGHFHDCFGNRIEVIAD